MFCFVYILPLWLLLNLLLFFNQFNVYVPLAGECVYVCLVFACWFVFFLVYFYSFIKRKKIVEWSRVLVLQFHMYIHFLCFSSGVGKFCDNSVSCYIYTRKKGRQLGWEWFKNVGRRRRRGINNTNSSSCTYCICRGIYFFVFGFDLFSVSRWWWWWCYCYCWLLLFSLCKWRFLLCPFKFHMIWAKTCVVSC